MGQKQRQPLLSSGTSTPHIVERCGAFHEKETRKLMNKIEKEILENVFDSLDRLFDRKCGVYDVCDLIFASDLVLKNLNSQVDLGNYYRDIKTISQRKISEDNKRDDALNATDSLRELLNELLPI